MAFYDAPEVAPDPYDALFTPRPELTPFLASVLFDWELLVQSPIMI